MLIEANTFLLVTLIYHQFFANLTLIYLNTNEVIKICPKTSLSYLSVFNQKTLPTADVGNRYSQNKAGYEVHMGVKRNKF